MEDKFLNAEPVLHAGFAALLGRPNVGKSTLLNALLGEKVAIVSSRPQTTRNRITGVLTRGGTQVVFMDTPGMHHAKTKLGEHMVKAVNDSIADVDVAVLVVEPEPAAREAETELLEKLAAAHVKTILAVNKVDTLPEKDKLMAVIAAWSERFDFAAVVPVSAKENDGVDALLGEIAERMPEGPHFFPDDTLTDQPERVIVAEIIREKLLRLLLEEVPHGTAVTVEKMHQREGRELIDIDAVIYCEKESHKGIIIGKGGAMLKKVGTLARADIERMTDTPVNLKLWVKVRDDWRNSENIIKSLGFN